MNMFDQLPLEFQLLSALGALTFIVVILAILVYWFLVIKDLVEEVVKHYLYQLITELKEEYKNETSKNDK